MRAHTLLHLHSSMCVFSVYKDICHVLCVSFPFNSCTGPDSWGDRMSGTAQSITMKTIYGPHWLESALTLDSEHLSTGEHGKADLPSGTASKPQGDTSWLLLPTLASLGCKMDPLNANPVSMPGDPCPFTKSEDIRELPCLPSCQIPRGIFVELWVESCHSSQLLVSRQELTGH